MSKLNQAKLSYMETKNNGERVEHDLETLQELLGVSKSTLYRWIKDGVLTECNCYDRGYETFGGTPRYTYSYSIHVDFIDPTESLNPRDWWRFVNWAQFNFMCNLKRHEVINFILKQYGYRF